MWKTNSVAILHFPKSPSFCPLFYPFTFLFTLLHSPSPTSFPPPLPSILTSPLPYLPFTSIKATVFSRPFVITSIAIHLTCLLASRQACPPPPSSPINLPHRMPLRLPVVFSFFRPLM